MCRCGWWGRSKGRGEDREGACKEEGRWSKVGGWVRLALWLRVCSWFGVQLELVRVGYLSVKCRDLLERSRQGVRGRVLL